MKKNKLKSAFHFSDNYSYPTNDYEVFQDKALLDELRSIIVENLIDHDLPEGKSISDYINEEMDKILEGYNISSIERNYLYNVIDNEVNGFGPISSLLQDDSVSKIMVNNPNEIFIESEGTIKKDESVSFINNEHIIRTIERMLGMVGKTIDKTNPMVDARLIDNSRITAIIPPLSYKGPVFTIRKSIKKIFTINDLVGNGTLTPYMAEYLTSAIKAHLNILICGSNSSGTTTLLNALAQECDDDERIITLEEVAELKVNKPHVLSFELDDKEINHDQFFNYLVQMIPDRVFVTELDEITTPYILRTSHTGIKGVVSTIFAKDIDDVIKRFKYILQLQNYEMQDKAFNQIIYDGIDLVVTTEKSKDGKRRVTKISEFALGEELKIVNLFEINNKGEYILNKNNKYASKKKINEQGINDINYMF